MYKRQFREKESCGFSITLRVVTVISKIQITVIPSIKVVYNNTTKYLKDGNSV